MKEVTKKGKEQKREGWKRSNIKTLPFGPQVLTDQDT